MRNVLISLALLVGSCSGGGPVGFVNLTRVVTESNTAKAMNDPGAPPAEMTKAIDDVNAAIKKAVADKAPEAEQKAVRDRAEKAANDYNANVRQREREGSDRLLAAVRKISDRLAQDHRMSLVFYGLDAPLFAAPGADLTAEVIAKLEAPPPTNEVTQVTALRAELEQLKKQVKEHK